MLRHVGFRSLYDKADGGTTTSSRSPFDELTVVSKSRDSTVLINVSDDYIRAQDITPIAMADQLWRAAA